MVAHVNIMAMGAVSRESVTPLLTSCIAKVVKNIDSHMENVAVFPPSLKDRLLQLMCKRGLINDRNIMHMVHKQARELDLSECEVSDVSLQIIAQTCRLLRKIDLNSAKGYRISITSLGISSLAASCPYLQVVYLRRCRNITDEAVISLSRHCPQLRYFNIGGCTQITDQALMALGQNCRYLKSLDFSKSEVTDIGVYSLVDGPCGKTLVELHISCCAALTDEAVEAITQFCPNITILTFHGCPLITDQSRVSLEELLGGQSRVRQMTWTVY